jgi:hypothetical protein
MNAGTLGSLFTVVVFGLFGWAVARLTSRGLSTRILVVLSISLVAAAIGASFIRNGIWLFGVDDFGGRLDLVIVASCLGGCVGLLMRACNRRRVEIPKLS